MEVLQNINISDFDYDLSDEKIAKYPLEKRDSSKLLIYKNNEISEELFSSLPDVLPENGLILFNNTKVIHARLLFRKYTGAAIEIFCLEPYEPAEYQTSFSTDSTCVWKCLVGNKKKWKSGRLQKSIEINNLPAIIDAEIEKETQDEILIRFRWDNKLLCFGEILAAEGKIPLPPYLNRDSEPIDELRYQTVYSHTEGSVAAPTAGLHFTESTLLRIEQKNISIATLTLHVGAGTFKPVAGNNIANHIMHREHFRVSIETLYKLKNNIGNITLTGTTSLRVVESLYWFASKIVNGDNNFHLRQWEAYNTHSDLSPTEALNTIIDYCQKNHTQEFIASTSIMILPGYRFRYTDRLITNFHQPRSTLLLLVAAFIGSDWRKVYNHAINNNFRFLSYGDSSLLYRKN